jgi:hypothetical protein
MFQTMSGVAIGSDLTARIAHGTITVDVERRAVLRGRQQPKRDVRSTSGARLSVEPLVQKWCAVQPGGSVIRKVDRMDMTAVAQTRPLCTYG